MTIAIASLIAEHAIKSNNDIERNAINSLCFATDAINHRRSIDSFSCHVTQK